jgi:hypothetical protein
VSLLSHHDCSERDNGQAKSHHVLGIIHSAWFWLKLVLMSVGGFCRLLAIGCLCRLHELICLDLGVIDDLALDVASEQVECCIHVQSAVSLQLGKQRP